MDEIIIKYGSDIAKLQADLRKVEQQQLNIDKGAKKSSKTIKDESEKAAKGVEKLDKNVNGLDATFKKVGGAIAGVFAVGQIIGIGKEIVSVTAEFQKFEAVLTNTLGSKSQAQAALAQIKEFAANTPFGVAELTGSFVKLANQGFKPTVKEMTKLGDIAASQGKSFDQLTEGLIDAQTGEFERLKEFGIRASKEGDNVKFTFKGVETQTKFTNDAIRDYVLSLGDAAGVSGSMAAISATVGGQISNLDDSFDSLFNTIGSGNSGVFTTVLASINSLVQGLELALTTQDQMQKKLSDMEDKARKGQYFAFLEKDIKKLTAVTESEGEARGLVLRNQIILIEEEIATLDRRIAAAKKFEDLNSGTEFTDRIKEMQKEAQYQRSVVAEIGEMLTALDKKEEGAAKKTQKEIDEEFKKRLDLLKKQEELAVRRAKLEEKTEGQIIKIHKSFNGQRIGIFNEFNKQAEIDYQDLLLRVNELDKEHSEFLIKEQQKREEEAKKHRDLLLSELDKSLKEENNLYAENFNIQLDQLSQRYIEGLINKEEFESQSAAMSFAIQKDSVSREIDLILSKLDIENLSYEQRIDLEESLLAKKRELGKIELDEFKRKEDEKAKKDKETQDKIEKRQKAVLEAVQRGIDLASSALNGLNDLALARAEAGIEDERYINEKKEAEQLASLEKRKQQGIISERQFVLQKDKILKESAKKEADLKRKQYEAEQKAAINRVNIETAVAIAKTVAQMGFIASLPLLPFVIANGEVQKALIRAQPVPKFLNEGEIDIQGPGTSTSDSISARLSKGESVIKAKQTAKYKSALSAINDDYFDKYADINFVQPALKKEREKLRMKEEREKAAHDYMKSLSLNGLLDTSHLERLTKKNKSVKLENVNELLEGMEKIMKPKSSRGL